MDINKEWVPVRWVLACTENDLVQVTIDAVPFKGGTRYAIRRLNYCLNDSLEWEYEPLSSHRSDEFFKRCRVGSMEEAKQRVNDCIEKENLKKKVG